MNEITFLEIKILISLLCLGILIVWNQMDIQKLKRQMKELSEVKE